MLRQITAGFAYVAKNADLRTISLLTAAQTIIWGALSVFMVVIAVRDFGEAESVGWLQGAMGVGTIIGGVMILGRVAKGRLASDMVIGVLGWVMPVIVLADLPLADHRDRRPGRHRHRRPVGQPRPRDDPAAARAGERHLPRVRRGREHRHRRHRRRRR